MGCLGFSVAWLAVILAFTIWTPRSDAAVTVTRVTPPRIGGGGGVQITIVGTDLMPEVKIPADPNKGIKVNLVSWDNRRSYACDVIVGYLANISTICSSRPMEEGDYKVLVTVDENSADPFKGCGAWCIVKVKSYYTPTITELTSNGLPAFHGTPCSSVLKIRGRIFTSFWNQTLPAINTTNGVTAKMLRAFHDVYICERTDANGDVLPVTLDGTEGEHKTGEMDCWSKSKIVGGHNVSFIIEPPYGRSVIDENTLYSDALDEISQHQVYPEITQVTPKQGSTAGGTYMTITGNCLVGVSSTTKVTVGGQLATIVSSTTTNSVSTIVVRTPAQGTAASSYAGNRGVNIKFWSQASLPASMSDAESVVNSATTPTTTKWYDASSAVHTGSEAFVIGEMEFFYVPAKTAKYSFHMYVSSGASAKFYLSQTDGDPSQKAALTVSTFDAHATDPSTMITLTAGGSYYTQIIFYGPQGASVNVSIFTTTSYFKKGQLRDVYNDVSELKFTSTVVNEIQNLDMTGLPSSAGTAVDDEFTVTIVNPGDGKKFRLCIAKGCSALIPTDDPAMDATIGKELNLCPALESGESVTVTGSASPYTVTITSDNGPIDLEAVDETGQANSAIITVTRTVTGVAKGNSHVFTMDGRRSTSVSKDASANNVQIALEGLSNVLCKPGVNPPSQGTPYFEELHETSGSDDEIPFCGKKSLKTYSWRIYLYKTSYNQNRPIPLKSQTHFGVALKGEFQALFVHLSLKTQTHNFTWERQIPFNFSTVDSSGWRYVLIDLYGEMTKQHSAWGAITVAYVHKIYVDKSPYFPRRPVYVDNFFVGLGKPVTEIDPTDLHNRRIIPPFRSKTVTVTKSGSLTYDVDLELLDCQQPSLFSVEGFPSSVTVTRSQTASPKPGGTFDVTWDSNTVSGIDAHITEEDFKHTLEAKLPGVGLLDVVKTGTCDNFQHHVKFLSNKPPQPSVQVPTNALTGNSVAVAWKHHIHGGQHYYPITGPFLKTVHDNPQVGASRDDTPAHCNVQGGNCDFEYDANLTPTLTSVSPSSGTAGDTLTIAGNNFDTTPANNVVVIGDADCVVQSPATAIQLTCVLGAGTFGTNIDVIIFVSGKGSPSSTQKFSYIISVTDIDPKSGSTGGGTLLTVTGSGFDSTATVTVGGTSCSIGDTTKDITPSSIKCVVPAGQTAGASTVVVSVGGSSTNSPNDFTYDSALTATISSISLSNANAWGGQTLSISGSGFGTSLPTVEVGDKTATVSAAPTDSLLEVTLPPLPAGTHDVKVNIDGKGYAVKSSGTPTLTVDFSITDVCPTKCSAYGGCTFTLQGTGFPTDPASKLDIKIGSTDCVPVQSVTQTSTQMVVKLNRVDREHKVTYKDDLNTYRWEPRDIEIEVGDCAVFEWDVGRGVTHNVSVVEVTGPTSTTAKTGGFTSPKSTTGTFKTCGFDQVGTYYYLSDKIDEKDSISIRGQVKVVARQAETAALTLKTIGNGGVEPTYAVAGSLTCGGSCPIAAVSGASCSTVGSVPSGIAIGLDPCYAPSVTSMTPKSGDGSTTITIAGSSFGTNRDCVEVTIGDHSCVLPNGASSDTSIQCTIDHQNNLQSWKIYAVSVNILSKGFPLQSASAVPMTFDYKPVLDSVSPTSGSLAGGQEITLTGSGFADMSDTAVAINGIICDVTSATYTQVLCTTGSSNADFTSPVTLAISSMETPCSSTCDFSMLSSVTPTITSVTPTLPATVDAGATVTIAGTKFGTVTGDVNVKSGTETCTVTNVIATEITCTIDSLPASSQDLEVSIAGVGKATGSFSVTGTAQLTAVTPTTGSTNGGTTLTLDGNGFIDGSTSVTVNSKACTDITVINPGKMTCLTPANAAGAHTVSVSISGSSYTFPTSSFTYAASATPEVTTVTPASGVADNTITITGSGFSTTPADNVVSVGTASWTVTTASTTSLECTVGANVPGNFPVGVSVKSKGLATSSSTFTYDLDLNNITPHSGSLGGSQLVTVSGKGIFASSASLSICGKAATGLTDVTGGVTAYTPASTTAGACDVSVTVSGTTETLTGAFTYSQALTPEVTAVSPRRGGTAGGTSVTISGTNFGSSTSALSVTIDDVSCSISSSSTTQIVCVTGAVPRNAPTRAKCGDAIQAEYNVVVQKGSDGIAASSYALNGAPGFQYVDVWSSKYTWGGVNLPQKGEFVVIPSGQYILLDTQTPVLKMLLIEGCLVFDDQVAASKTVKLEAEYILLNGGGHLQVGTETDPYLGEARIKLHGHVRSQELPVYGAKVLAIRNGTLDLHGRPTPTTWTRLAQTAAVGATTINLQIPVNWRVDDEIIIVTTGDYQSQKQTEKCKIASISSDGLVLTLDSPLLYEHLGITETYNTGDCANKQETFDLRAEVALLTHNIKVVGSDDGQFNDPIPACPRDFKTDVNSVQSCFQGRFGAEVGSDQFGVHIMFNPPERDSGDSRGRISAIEITHAGQAFRLGRYAIHFHNGGDFKVDRSYVRDSAIHHSFNRALNIHGSKNIVASNNVAYNIMGGAFFLEDSAETNNTFEYNLVTFVKASTSLQNDDVTAAAFWVTHPWNFIRHNTAVGGTHFGYWYRPLKSPGGSNLDQDACPYKEPLLQFFNNSAHSCGWYGLWVFEHYFPSTGCNGKVSVPAVFDHLTVWHCLRGAEWGDTGAIQINNGRFANNYAAGVEGLLIKGNAERFSLDHGAAVTNTLIIGHFNLPSSQRGSVTIRGLVVPFNHGLLVENVTFVNFDGEQSEGLTGSAIGTVRITCVCKNLCCGYKVYFSGIRWCSAPSATSKALFEWEHQAIWIDRDGSLTGQGAGALALSKSNLIPPACAQAQEWSKGPHPGVICPGSLGLDAGRLTFNNPEPSSLLYKRSIISNKFGTEPLVWRKQSSTNNKGWLAVLPLPKKNDPNNKDYDYTMFFENAEHIANFSYEATYGGFKPDNYVIMRHNVSQEDPYDLMQILAKPSANAGESPTPLSSSNDNGDWTFYNTSKILSYIIKADDTLSSVQDVHVRVLAKDCFVPGCIVQAEGNLTVPVDTRPSNFFPWSQSSTWMSTKSGRFWTDSFGAIGVGVPAAGASVTIDDGSYVVFDDANAPALKSLDIKKGTVEVEPSLDGSLQLTTLVISGDSRFKVGTPAAPHTGDFSIILEGDHSTPEYPTFDGPKIGYKSIAVFGGFDAHGRERVTYWSKLETTANAGDNTVTIATAVSGYWFVGDEIVVTPTSFSPWQAETFKLTAVNGKVLTLNATLKYKHLVHKDTSCASAAAGACEMIGEVGLLTRNVKIIGHDGGKLFSDSCGCRMVVGTRTNFDDPLNPKAERGWARISNTEFVRCGQEGFIEKFDPRAALAYVGTGVANEFKPSYVHGSTFHQCLGEGVCAYGTDGLNFTNNIIHHTIGSAFKTDGANGLVDGNLATLNIWPGAYQDRREVSNKNFEAAFKVNKATHITLRNNVIAGSERVGYRINGETCIGFTQGQGVGKSFNNEAHTLMIGLAMFPDEQDGVEGEACSRIDGLVIWRAFGYGIYTQTTTSMLTANVKICECQVAIFNYVIGPSIFTGQSESKTTEVVDSTIVGLTSAFDCDADKLDTSSGGADEVNVELGDFGIPAIGKGCKVGILTGAFNSAINKAPFTEFNKLKKPPAGHGRGKLYNSCIAHFKVQCNCRNTVFHYNPSSRDLDHPMEAKSLVLEDVDKSSITYVTEPKLGIVNAEACGSMDCDGPKKAMIIDIDGTLSGSEGAYLPKADFEWNGDPRRGFGDYRIPQAMLQDATGKRRDLEDVYTTIGIPGIQAADYDNEMQVYVTKGKYEMFHIQSEDPDFTERTLSPVAIRSSDGYLDLVNGPANSGVCTGYACRNRPSIFYFIIRLFFIYEVFFTGTPPQTLTVHFPYTTNDDAFELQIFNPSPQLLEVYHTTDAERYILPVNGYFDAGEIKFYPKSHQIFNLSMVTDGPGANLYDYDTKMLKIIIKGPGLITVKTKSAIILKIGLAMSEADFYNENIVQNLALFLGIPAGKVRVVDIVAENSGSTGRKRRSIRGRRSTESVNCIIQISDSPASGGGSQNLGYNSLLNVYYTVSEGYQDGTLGKALGDVTFTYVQISQPLPPADSEEWQNMVKEAGESGSTVGGGDVTITVPHKMQLYDIPKGGYESGPFFKQPTLRIIDENWETVTILSTAGSPWTVTASMYNYTGDTTLLGTSTATFIKGWANFTDLSLSRVGSYKLIFQLSHPASFGSISSIVTATPLAVTQRALNLFAEAEGDVTVGKDFNLIMTVRDTDGALANDLNWRGHTWTYQMSIHDLFNATLSGATSGQLESDGTTTSGSISLNQVGHSAVKIVMTSNPSGYEIHGYANIHVLHSNYKKPTVDKEVSVTMTIKEDYGSIQEPIVFKAFISNQVQALVGDDVVITNPKVESGSIIVSFDLSGSNASLTSALASLSSFVDQSCPSLAYQSLALSCSSSLVVDGKVYGSSSITTTPKTAGRDITLPLVLGICIPIAVILLIIIVAVLIINRGKKHKKLFGSENSTPEPTDPYRKSVSPKFSSQSALLDSTSASSRTNIVATPPPTSGTSWRRRLSASKGSNKSPEKSPEKSPKKSGKPLQVVSQGEGSFIPPPSPALYNPPPTLEKQDSAMSQISKQEFNVGYSPREIPFNMSDVS